MSDESLREAVAAGILAAGAGRAELLQSIVDVARAIFGSQAASIMLHDAPARELVFEAVSGAGQEEIIGRRLPESTGVAGWVLAAREPIIIENLEQDKRFSKDVAASTGYVPKGMMVAPLLIEERVLGVLSVLDRPQRSQFSLVEMDLLGLFAHQAAIALDLLGASARAKAALADADPELAALARIASSLVTLEGDRRDAGVQLLAALDAVFTARSG